MKNEIRNFFYPANVCIVGASSRPLSIGYEILKSIKSYSYTGEVFPVNPKSENILDYKCYKSILKIKQKIDLAIVVVPKRIVDESIDQLISKNVKSIILITAGFRETGEEGKEHEEQLLKKIKNNGIRLVGPNCMGVINTLAETKLNATFVAEKPEQGRIGFLSQSGALGAAVLNSLRETNIKLAHFVSVGNKADVSENDILEFWLNDININVLTFYLESFEKGLEFLKIYKNNKSKKPIIVLKAGRTQSGMKAASSHTGALSSNDKITNALLKQFGIIRARNLNEMFNTAKGFENFPISKGNRVAVITNAGGPAILAVDKLEERGLVLSDLSNESKLKLKEIVLPEGSINNPIDLLPGGSAEVYKKVNEIILQDEKVDAIVSIFVEPVMVNAFEVIESINSITSDKPIYQVCMPLPEFWEKYENDSKKKTPIFRQPEEPAEIISNILLYEKKKTSPNSLSEIKIENLDEKTNLSNDGYFLSQTEVEEFCNTYKIPIVENKILSEAEIKEYADFSFPLVVKGLNQNVIHKSELNAVKINIANENELSIAVNEIIKSFNDNGFKVENYLVQPFIKTKHELLIGGVRDNSFGPIVMFGSGGKYVEVFEDTEIRSAYLTNDDIDEMISQTKIGKILKGVRGEKEIKTDTLKTIIKSVSQMMIENKNILEIDLNPLIVDDQNKYFAVDVRIKVTH
ncbi:MAG: acetyl-CoA synthetase [Ignavibacteriae bacterium]|nr:acetyl-CoA synthetase [Ignavibacteriota bacterium]